MSRWDWEFSVEHKIGNLYLIVSGGNGMMCCSQKLTASDLSPDPIRQGVTSIFVQRVKNTVANEDLSGKYFRSLPKAGILQRLNR